MKTITKEVAARVLEVVDAGLVKGLGKRKKGYMCVEAAVCYALDLPHSDDPGCVSQPLRRLKIRLNDSSWSSTQTRATGLRRLALAQLGSAGVLDDKEFVRRVIDVTIRKVVPFALRAAAKKNPTYALTLEQAAIRCEQEGTREACLHAQKIAHADANYVANAANTAANVAYADANYAANDANAAANAAANVTYAANADGDKFLAQFAEWVVEILIDMKAPGCQWLDLAPLKAV